MHQSSFLSKLSIPSRIQTFTKQGCISLLSSLRNNNLVCTSSCTSKQSFSGATIDHTQFLTDVSKCRKPSAVREIQPLLRVPGMISLAAGTPSAKAFPFLDISFQIPTNPIIKHTCSSNDCSEPESAYSITPNITELSLTQSELNMALQYSPTSGVPPFVELLKTWHFKEHSPPYASEALDVQNFDLIVSTGSQDLLTRFMTEVIDFDSDTNRKDSVIIEAPCYSGTLAFLRPYYDSGKINLASVELDNEGMIPSVLENKIKQLQNQSGKTPKLLYVIPTGQNPSGVTYSFARKHIIYEIACKYNMLILEDDPYYDMQFNSDSRAPNTFEQFSESFIRNQSDTGYKFYNKSFQSIDTEGRVLRCDSFSKVMSSGLRLGYATGPSKLVNQLVLNAQATHLHTCGISQLLCFKLLERWGEQKFKEHKLKVAYMYYKQRDKMEQCLLKYLSNDYSLKSKVTWDTPTAGMFYWLTLENCFNKDNDTKIEDTQILIKEKALEHKVLMLPGKVFYVDEPQAQKCAKVRVSFSTSTEKEMNQGIKRFRNLLA